MFLPAQLPTRASGFSARGAAECGQSRAGQRGLPGAAVTPPPGQLKPGPPCPGSDLAPRRRQGSGATGRTRGSIQSWKLVWRQKRKMKALKMREMLKHGVRVRKVHVLQPAAPSVSQSPQTFPPGQEGDGGQTETDPSPTHGRGCHL